jgi:hypothetical protein
MRFVGHQGLDLFPGVLARALWQRRLAVAQGRHGPASKDNKAGRASRSQPWIDKGTMWFQGISFLIFAARNKPGPFGLDKRVNRID